jgi:hypothetical protein
MFRSLPIAHLFYGKGFLDHLQKMEIVNAAPMLPPSRLC